MLQAMCYDTVEIDYGGGYLINAFRCKSVVVVVLLKLFWLLVVVLMS